MAVDIPDTHKLRPTVIAFGGSKGGVGRTTLTLEMARVLTRRGKSVVIVDCTTEYPVIADLLDGELAERGGEQLDFSPFNGVQCTSSKRPVDVITLRQQTDRVPDVNEAAVFFGKLLQFERDFVLLDLPPRTDPFWLEVYIKSDVPILVTAPDPWSVRATLPFVKSCKKRLAQLGQSGKEWASRRSYLLINGCRDNSERDLGEVLCHAFWRKMGHYPRFLGPVDFDDRRWFHLRHNPDCPPLSSSDGLGVQMETLGKRILRLDEFDVAMPRTREESPSGMAKTRLLGLSENTSSDALRTQYRKLWEGYRRESAVTQVIMGESERQRVVKELEQTYRALKEAIVDTPAQVEAVSHEATERSASQNTQRLISLGTDLFDSPDLLHAGLAIKRSRELKGLSLHEFSLRTRVGSRYIEAIEEMDAESLPKAVYLRGYLREIARVLDFPVDFILDRYLTELASRNKGRVDFGSL